VTGVQTCALPISEEKSAGGILLPNADKKTTTQGKVVAVGPGSRNSDGTLNPMGVHEGDTVIYSQYGATEVKVDGLDYLVLSENNILGVLN
jgi:chaperonin GroES